MEQNKEISNYHTLVDTSSVVAHDLCAQLHVLQFCLEELEEHVSDGGKEYLDRMGISTHYIADLVNSFRKQLKISLSDDRPEPLDKVMAAAMELVNNHFSIVIEKLELSSQGQLSSFILKNSAQKSMLVIFALYATFIEDFKEKGLNEQDRLAISFSARSKNSRFVRVEIEVNHTRIDKERFESIVAVAAPEKGKLRNFVGLNLLKDFRKENPERFKINFTPDGALIEFQVPLYLSE